MLGTSEETCFGTLGPDIEQVKSFLPICRCAYLWSYLDSTLAKLSGAKSVSSFPSTNQCTSSPASMYASCTDEGCTAFEHFASETGMNEQLPRPFGGVVGQTLTLDAPLLPEKSIRRGSILLQDDPALSDAQGLLAETVFSEDVLKHP
jgi:hypothetical protein